jgi:hypothetical protein
VEFDLTAPIRAAELGRPAGKAGKP